MSYKGVIQSITNLSEVPLNIYSITLVMSKIASKTKHIFSIKYENVFDGAHDVSPPLYYLTPVVGQTFSHVPGKLLSMAIYCVLLLQG